MSHSNVLDRESLDQNFGDLWPVHNRQFTALMTECRKLFDGDMDQMLILSVIGDRTLAADRTKGISYDDFLTGKRADRPPGRINTQSVADSTGIPRETVRRKIIRLIGRGWVRKNEDGSLEVTKAAAVDLAPATEATFAYMLCLGNALLRATAEAPAARGDLSAVDIG